MVCMAVSANLKMFVTFFELGLKKCALPTNVAKSQISLSMKYQDDRISDKNQYNHVIII